MPNDSETDDSRPALFKDWFDEKRYRKLAEQLGALSERFDRKRFLALTLEGLPERSLMERLRQAAMAADAALPGGYRKKLAVLRHLAPRLDHEFVAIFLCDFVAQFGLEDFDHSMEALRHFTTFGSAEFAVRPFLMQDQEKALAMMLAWTGDADEKVRRLASEGSRPRLPWGLRLKSLVANPNPLAPILEALRNDPALFVRRSVANNLNDIAKDHPDWVIRRLQTWDRTAAGTAWIAKHASRTLIKRGHPEALSLFGFHGANVSATLSANPQQITLGGTLTLSASVTSATRSSQRLVVDYVVHYVKANGGTSAKVFKWCELDLPGRGAATLTKRQTIRDFTTRRHHPGRHAVELQVNGQRVAEAAFLLR